MTNSANWNLSVRRICQYATGQGKVWSADSSSDITMMSSAQRSMIIGTYLLIRNSTSYIVLLPGLYWYPDYEIDLGGYVDEPPADIEMLRVAGTGGESGGLYARQEVAGTIVVNSSSGPLAYTVPTPMVQAEWSGGGAVTDNPVTEASESLTYTANVPAGPLTVPALSAIILRSPKGVPPPGVLPGGGGSDAGPGSRDGGSTRPKPDAGGGGVDAGGAVNEAPSGSTGCSCREAPASMHEGLAFFAAGLLLISRRRLTRRPPRERIPPTPPPWGIVEDDAHRECGPCGVRSDPDHPRSPRSDPG